MKRSLIAIVSLAYLAACGGSESKKADNRQVRNQAVSTRGFPTQNLGSNSTASKDPKSEGVVNAVNKFGDAVDAQMAKDKADAEAQAKDKENQRNFQAAERDKDRKHDAEMQSQRLAAKEKGQFMQSLTDMMHMQMMFKMMHPDKCADNWFSGALKGTAGALKEAMDTTDKAATKTSDGKLAANVKPGAVPAEKKMDVINPMAPMSPVDAASKPATTTSADATSSGESASSAQVMGPPAPTAATAGADANKVSSGSSESSGSPPPPKT